jgi:hypothetical protein
MPLNAEVQRVLHSSFRRVRPKSLDCNALRKARHLKNDVLRAKLIILHAGDDVSGGKSSDVARIGRAKLDEFTSILARFGAQSRAIERTLTAIHPTNRGFGTSRGTNYQRTAAQRRFEHGRLRGQKRVVM